MFVGCLEGGSDVLWLVGSGMLEAESMSFYKGNGLACKLYTEILAGRRIPIDIPHY